MTSQTINLNLIPGSIEPVINVSQYDKGQTWNFNIYSGSQPFTIPTGSSITIQGTKPDKTGFQYGCTFSGNVVTAIEQQQMTILSGKVPAEIVITKNDELIGSLNFNIMVEKAALADDTAISETDLPLIEEAVEALSHIDETLETMKGYKEDSEAYANGKRNGSDVGSSDPAYHNNSKYYAGQASSSASSASGSATSAGTNALISEGYAVGKQNGSAVGSGSPYYQNNAEYYKGQAANSATNAGNSATAASGSATTASNKALVAEGYADGKQNGTDVASGSPYYHNNSKYYSEQAAASAQSAAQSAASFTVDSALSTSSTNPVQNKVITTDLNNVKQALSNEVVTRAELGAHNLLKLDLGEIKSLNTDGTWSGNAYTLNGVTFTVNSDYTISTNGTASANTTFYLHRYSTWTKLPLKFLSGCPSGGGMDKYILRLVRGGVFSKNDTGEGVLLDQDDIASPVDVTMVVVSGNNVSGLTFKPMIKLNTDAYTGYLPHVPKNSQLLSYKDNGVLGAKNLLENSFFSKSGTFNGATVVANDDGSFSISWTKSNTNYFYSINEFIHLPKGRYKLSGCPAGGGYPTTYSLYMVYVSGQSDQGMHDIGEGAYFDIDNDNVIIKVRIGLYQTVSNLTFKPMITLASDTDPTYQPYAKTNTELTKDTKGLTDNQFGNSCVNLLENEGSSVVTEGITFTVNADKSVSAYGTLEANKNVVFVINANKVYSDFIGKRLKLSGCPKNTGLSVCRITVYRVESADGSSGSVFDYGDGVVYEHLNNGTGIRVHYQIEMGNGTSSPVSINTTFKPMITVADMPNSDYAHYVPYAKSNKELTDVAEQVEGNYVFTGMNSVSVTADGIKTWQTLFNELINSLDSYLSSHTDEYIRITGLLYATDYVLAPSNYDVYMMYHNSISTGLRFSNVDMDDSSLIIRVIHLAKTLVSNKNFVSNNGVITDYISNVASSGRVTSIYFESYKQIS